MLNTNRRRGRWTDRDSANHPTGTECSRSTACALRIPGAYPGKLLRQPLLLRPGNAAQKKTGNGIGFNALAIAFVLAIAPALVSAAEWSMKPTLDLKAGYDDNIRMTTDNKVSSAVGTVSPSAVFSVTTPNSGASGSARFDFRRYEDDSNLDDNNSYFNLDLHHDRERSRLGLGLGFTRDTTLDSQLEATGLVFDRVRRQSITASPNWTWALDERTQFGVGYTYNDVEYKNAGDTGFVNFNVNSGQLFLNRAVNERTSASLSLSRTRSDNDNDVKSTNTSIRAGGSYRFSETLSTSLSAGLRYTEVDFSQSTLIPVFIPGIPTPVGFLQSQRDVSKSDSGYVFSGSITRTFLRGQVSLSASRDISNDINGTPREVRRLSFSNLYRFSETLSGQLQLQLYNTESGNGFGQTDNRNYYAVTPSISWKFAQFWSLSGSYRYRLQTFDNSSDEAIGNAAYLTLTYRWPKIAVSR
jgi:hypothetical protein